jgi:MATE family multidrug resistance protein
MVDELNRRILRLAVPNVLASISVPLIGIVDTAMIGHLPEVAFLGAVATASVIFDVLFWSAGFLRMGTTSLVAQYYGAGQKQACMATLLRALVLAFGIAVAVLLLRDVIAWAGFELAGAHQRLKNGGSVTSGCGYGVSLWC